MPAQPPAPEGPYGLKRRVTCYCKSELDQTQCPLVSGAFPSPTTFAHLSQLTKWQQVWKEGGPWGSRAVHLSVLVWLRVWLTPSWYLLW